MLIALWIISMVTWIRSIILLPDSSIPAFCFLYTDWKFERTMIQVFGTITSVIPFIIILTCHIKITRALRLYYRASTTRNILNRLRNASSTIAGRRSQHVLRAVTMLRRITYVHFICCLFWLFGFHTTIIGHAERLNSYLVGVTFIFHYCFMVATGLTGSILHIISMKKLRQPLQSCLIAIHIYRRP